MAKSMDSIMKELGIRECPICGKEYSERPALSRKDNKTKICPHCGLMEGLDAYLTERLENKENDSKYCIFENKICRFANKNGNAFSCEAPSDEALKLICEADKE